MVGIEKSGAFVDHANAIADFMAPGSIMTLDNTYIAEKIRLRASDDVYGVDEFYGRRLFYKTSTDQMIVFTIPRVPAGQPYEPAGPDRTNPSEDLSSYPGLRAIVEALDRLQTRLYPNAVIPVALAHSEASLPLGTGRSVLTLLAQQHLGTRITHSLEITGPDAGTVGPQVGHRVSADFPQEMADLIAVAGSRRG
jgi:hypothetical protein